MAVGTSRTDTSEALNVPDQHSPPPGYEAPIVCDGIVDLRSTCRAAWPGAHDVEYALYHICSSKTVVHKIYHDERHPSHLVLPIIPLA